MSSPPTPRSDARLATIGCDDPRWSSFVTSQPDALPFHHPSWSRLIERTYGFHPFVLAVLGGNDQILSGTPVIDVKAPLRRRRWICLPYVDYCAPLSSQAVADARLTMLLDEARQAAGVKTLEIRAALQSPAVETRSAWVQHSLRLTTDLDAQFAALHSTCKRNVRVAERHGIEIRNGEDVTSLVNDFYSLHVATRRRLGAPVQPRRFFRYLWEEIIASGLGHVVVACAERQPVAAAVFLAWNGTVIYKYGASDHRAWKARPNNLLFWHAIRTAAASGAHTFDFGRTALEQDGLRAFKASWGATEAPLVYSYLGEDQPEVGNRNPAALLAPVVRRSPLVVTRLLGELLYRYAA